MNFELYKDVLSAQIEMTASKLTGWYFKVQMDSKSVR